MMPIQIHATMMMTVWTTMALAKSLKNSKMSKEEVDATLQAFYAEILSEDGENGDTWFQHYVQKLQACLQVGDDNNNNYKFVSYNDEEIQELRQTFELVDDPIFLQLFSSAVLSAAATGSGSTETRNTDANIDVNEM